ASMLRSLSRRRAELRRRARPIQRQSLETRRFPTQGKLLPRFSLESRDLQAPLPPQVRRIRNRVSRDVEPATLRLQGPIDGGEFPRLLADSGDAGIRSLPHGWS